MSLDELKEMAAATFGDMVKAVVDIERGIFAVDAELHSDLEAALLQDGSKQRNLWGINIVRPSQGNRSREVQDEGLRARILEIVNQRVPR